MNIILVNADEGLGEELAGLSSRFNVCVTMTSALSHYDQEDLLFFDAGLGEAEILAHIPSQESRTKWLVVNQDDGPHQTLKYIQAGASGVLKRIDEESLIRCIREIESGGLCLDQDMTQLLAMRQIKKLLAPFNVLNSREFDVFCLLAEGYPVAYIAENLGISNKTAFNCQALLRKKLDLGSQEEIEGYAKKHGLIR